MRGPGTKCLHGPGLQALSHAIDPALDTINEPKRSQGGVPDFLFQRSAIPIGWAEAKDIDKDVIQLKGTSVEQRRQLRAFTPDLLHTNGVDLEFICKGHQVHLIPADDSPPGLGPPGTRPARRLC